MGGGGFGYGDSIDSPGGKALEHVVSLQLLVNQVDASKFNQKKVTSTSQYGDYVGHNMQVTTKKSKVSRPNQKAKAFVASEYELEDGTEVNGFDPMVNFAMSADNNKILETRGSWKVFVDKHGQEHKKYMKDWLMFFYHNEDPELIEEIVGRTYFKMFQKGYPAFNNSIVDVTHKLGMTELKRLFEEQENATEEHVEESEAVSDGSTEE